MTDQVLHYNRVARWLHWTIAVLIIANLVLGIFHDGLGKAFPAMPIHKSIGLLVLLLSLIRLGWRLTHPAPPLPASMTRIEIGLAHGLHWLLYALMIVMPLSGWIFSSAGKYPLGFFDLFEIPKFALTKADPIVGLAHQGHVVLGYAMAALVVGHIGAALRHQFWVKDGVLRRMWPAG